MRAGESSRQERANMSKRGAAQWRERLAGIYELGDTRNPKRNLPMEGLRGFAVLLVFFVHYHALFHVWLGRDSLSFAFSNFLGTIGLAGVDLFFVLSGYLIYGLIFKKPGRYTTFIKRRVERIYPTFLFVLAVYLLLSALFPSASRIPSSPAAALLYIAQNVLLLPGLFKIEPIITVAWSLSYEFFYYLLIPMLVAALGMTRWRKGWRTLFFSALALGYTIYCLTGSYGRPHLLMFISGILLFEAADSYRLGKRLTASFDYLVLAILVLTFPLIYALTERPELFPFLPNPHGLSETYRIIVLFLSFGLFTFACFDSRGVLKALFSWTPLRWLGNMSYSYYLIHGLTLKAISLVVLRAELSPTLATLAFWLSYPLFFLLTLVTSTLLFIYVEKRFSLLTSTPKPAQSKAPAPDEAAPSTIPSNRNLPPLGAWQGVQKSE
jgi:exopolysaccharide production protein ExoZ